MFAELAERILSEVGEALPADVLAGLARVVGPAAGPAWDCPMLYVALASATRQTDSKGCVTHTDLEWRVGIVREVCVVDDRGVAPTAREITGDGLAILDDAGEIVRALEGLTPSDFGARVFDVGTWTPLGPDGGMGGGEWMLRVRVVE